MNSAKRRMALVDIHGVVLKLTADETLLTLERFRLYVEKVKRMAQTLVQQDAEAMRDELLILDAFGKGVPLSPYFSADDGCERRRRADHDQDV